MSAEKIVYVDNDGNADGIQFPMTLRGAWVTAPGNVSVTPLAPNKNARVDEWRGYAVSMGMDAGEAAEATRDELVERYGA